MPVDSSSYLANLHQLFDAYFNLCQYAPVNAPPICIIMAELPQFV